MPRRHSSKPSSRCCATSTRKRATWSASRPNSTTHGYVQARRQQQQTHLCPTSPSRLTFLCKQGLIKSTRRDDQQLGVVLLSEIFRTCPERRRECLYYLALGHFKLGSYAEARRYNDLLLEREPANLQASNLRTLIDDKVAREGLVGVAIVSGLAVAAGVIGGVLMRNMGRVKR